MDIHVVILAAGKGTRMRSARPKVLHQLAGRPLIDYVLRAAATLTPRTTTLVIGHGAEEVRRALAGRSGLQYAVQGRQLGTAHALLQAEPLLARATGTLVLLSGDVPRLTPRTLTALVAHHEQTGAAATVLTAVVERPFGYGRVIRVAGQLARIVEERDASPAEREVREINAGVYAFALGSLFEAIRAVEKGNAQGEYYLPDVVSVLRGRRLRVETVTVEDAGEIQGINSRSELANVGRIVRLKKNEELMAAGVTLVDPATTYVDEDVRVGADTILQPCVFLEGHTQVGAGCEIQAGSRIVNSKLGDRVTVKNHCLIVDATIADGATVGPFAHLRAEAAVGPEARVGNFVELKKTSLGRGSKAMHHAYLGDALIGEQVNVGAGTITCNYDGERKHQTIIADGAFIGSDSQLVAPVTIGEGAYVGSGTTVRENVPPGALAVSAGKQRNIEGWTEKKKKAPKG